MACSVAGNFRIHWEFLFSFHRLLLLLSVSTPSGLGAPSWPPCPPSSKCGSASKSMMRQAHLSSTANASKVPSLLVYLTFKMTVLCFLESSSPPSLISHQSLYSLFTHVQFICASNIYCFINKPDQDLQPTKDSLISFWVRHGVGPMFAYFSLWTPRSVAWTQVHCNITAPQSSSKALVWHLAGSGGTKFWFWTLVQNRGSISYLKRRSGFASRKQEMESDKTIL